MRDQGTSGAARTNGDPSDGGTAEGPPPVGGSWRVLYAAVLLNLAVLVLLFYLFTRAFG